MSDRNIGQETLAGIQEIKRFKKGEVDLKIWDLQEPSPAGDRDNHKAGKYNEKIKKDPQV